VQKH
jgi:hypothetical protein